MSGALTSALGSPYLTGSRAVIGVLPYLTGSRAVRGVVRYNGAVGSGSLLYSKLGVYILLVPTLDDEISMSEPVGVILKFAGALYDEISMSEPVGVILKFAGALYDERSISEPVGVAYPEKFELDRGVAYPEKCELDCGVAYPEKCELDCGVAYPEKCELDRGVAYPENCELDSGVENPEKRVVSKSSNPANRAMGVDSCTGIPVLLSRKSRTSDSPNGNRLAGTRPARAACAACPDRTSCCKFDQLGTRAGLPPITASDGKLRLNGAVRLNGLTNDGRRLIDAALPIPDSSLVLPVSPFVSAPIPAPF